MKQQKGISRRKFLQKSIVTTGSLALLGSNTLTSLAQQKTVSPNEVIRIGVIGCGGMGNAHIGAIQNLRNSGYPVEIVAVCDVYDLRLEAAAQRTGATPYKDYRKLLERKDIDCVSIATPDHWHAQMTIDAAEAGKDVYCEKPMCYWKDLRDTQKVVATIAKTKRVMQVGTQGMSDSIWEQVSEKISAGAIGELVHAQASDMRRGPIGCYEPTTNDGKADPTKNLDWEMWLGPAKKRPWEPARFFAFRSFWDYSGGCGTDFFPHILTPLIRTMGLKFPKRVMGTGGQYVYKDGREIPDIFTITAEYEGGPSILLVASLANNSGIPMVIRGHDGTVTFEGPGAVIAPQGGGKERIEIRRQRSASLEEHFKDFFECMRSRSRKPRSNEILGYYVMTVLHMGVTSYLKGKVMEFDPATEQAKFV
jgi:predicted dehydrogenase